MNTELTTLDLFSIASWATEQYNKCKFWQFNRKKNLLKIILETYKDITR